MSFEKAVNTFLKTGQSKAVYRLTRENVDGSRDIGIAHVILGPHNLSQFRTFERTSINGDKTTVEDVIIISQHEDGRSHWIWYNDYDESWVGEQFDNNKPNEKGISVRGHGRIGRGHDQEYYQQLDFSAYREGDVVYGEMRDVNDDILLTKATYHPIPYGWESLEGHDYRVAQYFGLRCCNELFVQYIQTIIALIAIVFFALQMQKKGVHPLFYWLMSAYMLVGSFGALRVQRWESALPMFGLGIVLMSIARS